MEERDEASDAEPGRRRDSGATLRRIRRGLLVLLGVGLLGAAVDLVLLEHTESFEHWFPIGVLAVALAIVVGVAIRPSHFAVRALQIAMLASVATGVWGLYLHYRGNVEFELEMYPSIGGVELFWNAVKGATPALAPGVMIGIGLLGLIYAFRHRALDGVRSDWNEEER